MAGAQNSGSFLQKVSNELCPGSSGVFAGLRSDVFSDALEGGIILAVGWWTVDTFQIVWHDTHI